ncbi:MAG: plastocyanin/azurin family copper-binding protein, partial [Nitrosopumilus sp.]
AAIILGSIAVDPDGIIQPRIIPVEEMAVVSEAETSPMALTISIPKGVGVPGCEETNECYSPYEISVAVGTTVTWINDDIAAHTVTSGNFPEHDGLFDSSIFLSGDTFEITFSDAGTFDYYCFVHPWMAGTVNVE